MASDNLVQFLTRVSSDPSLLARLKADPKGVMDAARLTAEEQELVRSGDAQRLREHLGDGPVHNVLWTN